MAKKVAKSKKETAPKKAEAVTAKQDRPVMPMHTLSGTRKVKQLVTSAPHFKFEKVGTSIAFKPTSKIIPTEGEFANKLIGWNGVNLDTGEVVMIGNTHQVEKAFTTVDDNGTELWQNSPGFVITWLGKSSLGNGKTFNNYDIGEILPD